MNPLKPAYTKQVITTTTKTEKPKLTAFQQTGKHIPDTGAILGIVFAVIALLVLIALFLVVRKYYSRNQPKFTNPDIK